MISSTFILLSLPLPEVAQGGIGGMGAGCGPHWQGRAAFTTAIIHYSAPEPQLGGRNSDFTANVVIWGTTIVLLQTRHGGLVACYIFRGFPEVPH